MYNRYIPQPDGSYRRKAVEEAVPKQPEPHQQEFHQEKPQDPICPPPPPPKPTPPRPPHRPQKDVGAGDFLKRLLPQNLDTGDLIVILLLILMAGDCEEDRNTALLTLAIYLLM